MISRKDAKDENMTEKDVAKLIVDSAWLGMTWASWN